LHWISEYEERPVEVGETELERAAMLYFARSSQGAWELGTPEE
jgi:hypothetical protein